MPSLITKLEFLGLNSWNYKIFSLNHILNKRTKIAACIKAINHSNKVKKNNKTINSTEKINK